MTTEELISVLGPILALAGVVITILFSKKNQLERQLDSQKRKIFESFVKTLMTTIEKGENADRRDKEALKISMRSLKEDLILYGSPRTIRAHNRWIHEPSPNDAQNFKNIERLIRAFRNEIGLSNNFYFKKYEVLQVIINEDIAKTIKQPKKP